MALHRAASLLLLLAAIAGAHACPFAAMMQGGGDLEAAGRKLLQTCDVATLERVRGGWPLQLAPWHAIRRKGRAARAALCLPHPPHLAATRLARPIACLLVLALLLRRPTRLPRLLVPGPRRLLMWPCATSPSEQWGWGWNGGCGGRLLASCWFAPVQTRGPTAVSSGARADCSNPQANHHVLDRRQHPGRGRPRQPQPQRPPRRAAAPGLPRLRQ